MKIGNTFFMKNTSQENIESNQKSIIGSDVRVGENLNIGNTHNENTYYYQNESKWLYPLFSLTILSIVIIVFVIIFQQKNEIPFRNEANIAAAKEDTFDVNSTKIVSPIVEKELPKSVNKTILNKKKSPKAAIPQRPTLAFFDLIVTDDILVNPAFSFFAKRLAIHGINLSKNKKDDTSNGQLSGNVYLEKEAITLGAPGFRISFSINATLFDSNSRPQGKPYVATSEDFFLSTEQEILKTFKYWLESLYDDEFIQLTPL